MTLFPAFVSPGFLRGLTARRRNAIRRIGPHATATILALVFAAASGAQQRAQEGDLDPEAVDRSVLLVRDPSVQRDLGMTDTQRADIRKVMDAQDPQYWTLGNLEPKEGVPRLRALMADTERQVDGVLNLKQRNRFTQIRLQQAGLAVVLRPEIALKLSLTNDQERRIREVVEQTQEALKRVDSATQAAQQGNTPHPMARSLWTKQHQKILAILDSSQKSTLALLTGRLFDFSKVKPLALKAPDLCEPDAWINTGPLRPADLRGHVVVVHFYTFGCGNCQHNYPAYKAWIETFVPKGMIMVGIHTPETKGEHDIEKVKANARDHGLTFPILVDNGKKNWNAWGNSMWPSVYLVDKRGYVRYRWYGELNWKGAEGQKFMSGKIEELLAEEN
jgi:peroxiredoxin/Spy/CpxP family protein refolding chaperone